MPQFYEYPSSITAAATLLDKAKPGWHSKVNCVTLDMNNNHACILGQLFLSYFAGMRTLFDKTGYSNVSLDRIFGCKASKEAWIKETIARRNGFAAVATTVRKTVGKKSKDKLAKLEAALTKKAKTVTLIKQKRKQLEKLKADIDKLMATL